MKKIQTGIAKCLGVGLLVLGGCFCVQGQTNVVLRNADSLFKAKQFTQSFDLYQVLLKERKYSPAMLLKMAYIQEGQGRISMALYYLTLYEKVTHNEAVLGKISELATNNKLEGYNNPTPTSQLFDLLHENSIPIAGILAAIAVLLLAISINQKRKSQSPGLTLGVLAFVLILLLAHTNFNTLPESGITSNITTYLMTGPSAGANVVSIVGEGNKVEILGKEDVWLKVKWGVKMVWVKRSEVLDLKI